MSDANVVIRMAESDTDLRAGYPVMRELRPHLSESQFIDQVFRQMNAGYRLAMLEEGGTVKAVAGFRISECLAWGRFLYVDDLVTLPEQRSRGFGKHLLNWLQNYAARHGCREFHLDSGLQRHRAHSFYIKNEVLPHALHFHRSLVEPGSS